MKHELDETKKAVGKDNTYLEKLEREVEMLKKIVVKQNMILDKKQSEISIMSKRSAIMESTIERNEFTDIQQNNN